MQHPPHSSPTAGRHWALVTWQAAHLAGGGLLLMGTWLLLARYWEPERFGQFNVLFAYAAINGIIADFGLDVLITRHVAGHGERITAAAIRLKLLTSGAALASFLTAAPLLGFPIAETALLLCGATALSATGFVNGLLRGIGRLDLEAKAGLAQKTLFFVASALVVRDGGGLTAVATLYLLTHLLTLGAVSALALRHSTRLSPPPSRRVKEIALEALPLWMTALLAATLGRLDLFLLDALRGSDEVGHFSAAWRLAEGGFIVATAYVTALFPNLVKVARQGGSLSPLVAGATRLLAAGGVTAAAAGALAAPWLTTLLYGSAYAPAVPLLRGLFLSLPMLLLSGLFAHALVAMGQVRPFIFAQLIAILANVAVDLALIPAWGALGAVGGLVVRELVLFAILGATIFRSIAWPRTES
ncbi:oligosaccharide flippase family protein [Endothiovibrio diazotrophicus]